jgi:hypothetical protein
MKSKSKKHQARIKRKNQLKAPIKDSVEHIIPTKKDIDRAHGLATRRNSFYGNGSPFASNASKMAKLIKDRTKMVRRAKAVAAVWGTRDHVGYAGGNPIVENVWDPFAKAMVEMGFDITTINKISRYEHEGDTFAMVGLSDLIY